MVLSDIDHGNALLSGLSLDQTSTLQKLQKQEAKVILREREKKSRKASSETVTLVSSEKMFIKHKIVLKCLNNLSLQYLK